MQEIDHLLDQQMETLEASILEQEQGFVFNAEHEFVQDIAEDKNFFAILVSAKGEVTDASQGPPLEVRQHLEVLLLQLISDDEGLRTITWGHEHWRVAQEKVRLGSRTRQVSLLAAANLKPSLMEIADLRRAMMIGAISLLVLSICGTILIVSHSTRNLRSLARSLKTIQPQRLLWQRPTQPSSQEELLLFSNFESMLSTLKANQEAQKLFLAHASHELKTPVAALLTTLEVMTSRRREPKEYEQTARAMLHTVKSLQDLTSKLLDMSRLELHDELALGDIALTHWLQERIQHWQDQANSRAITLELEVPEKLSMRTDPQLLQVACDNFIQNAIKYSPDGSRIEVRCSAWPLRITIKDYGIGMKEEDQQRLGEIFFRADNARADSSSYGLGFAHAQLILKKLGAELSVTSRLGEGTTITLLWPG